MILRLVQTPRSVANTFGMRLCATKRTLHKRAIWWWDGRRRGNWDV